MEDGDSQMPDFAHDFLDRCVQAAKQDGDDLRRVYLEQYSQLIKHIGGRAVAEQTNKKILKNILSSDDSIQTMKDLSEIWETRADLIPKIVFDELSKRPDFERHPDDSNAVYRKIDEQVGVAFSSEYSLGYVYSVSNRTLSDDVKTKLRGFLDTVNFGCGFTQRTENEYWVYRDLDGNSIDDPINVVIDRIARIMEELESAYANQK